MRVIDPNDGLHEAIEGMTPEQKVKMFGASSKTSADPMQPAADGIEAWLNRPMDDASETEEDGIKAEAVRRSQVRRLFQEQPGRTPPSSPSPSSTPATKASNSAGKPPTSK